MAIDRDECFMNRRSPVVCRMVCWKKSAAVARALRGQRLGLRRADALACATGSDCPIRPLEQRLSRRNIQAVVRVIVQVTRYRYDSDSVGGSV